MSNTSKIVPQTVSISNANVTSTISYGQLSSAADCLMTVKDGSGALEVKGNIVMNGRDLEDRLSTIEQVLMIPERDVKLEKQYPKLAKMYEDYIKELAKTRMWQTLKGE